MPEIHFVVRWPDESVTACYSPSLVVRDYFDAGASYALPDFLARSREALGIASERVRSIYGVPCVRAGAQLALIEDKVRALQSDVAAAHAVVTVETFVATARGVR
ncbi:MAG: MSMEG_0570 family nitrogen starvation response protein [Vulcanimicrobiaceae bacterium]